jgi:DNA-binding MarR family transcriptional regulator
MLPCQHFSQYAAGVLRLRARRLPANLDEAHLAAWRSLLGAHAVAVGRIEHEIARAAGDLVPLAWYDILIALVEAPDHRLRQRDLSHSVVLTRSGISRLIDRLETAGLVRREPNPADRRGDLVVLTESGCAALRRTWPAYAQGIAKHFARHVRADEARVLVRALQRVRAASATS